MMPQPGTNVRHLPFLSVPTWDISDEEIAEWEKTPEMRVAAVVAKSIRDGVYDNGKELFPADGEFSRQFGRARVDELMGVLAERGMARTDGGSWHAIAPGRMEPSIPRAVAILLACRADLPPALAAELDSWKAALEAPGGTPASQAAAGRPVQPAGSLRALTAG